MASAQSADDIVADKFLEVRAKLLEIAATLDRIDRAAENAPLSTASIARRESIQEGIEIIASSGDDRAARLQMLYSRDYEPQWREKFGMTSS